MELQKLIETIEQSGARIHDKESIGTLDDDLNYNRMIHFSVGDKDYKIMWYKNLANLYIDENTQVMFNNLRCANTWPTFTTEMSKNQLQFMYDSDKVCIMITERYNK